MPNLNVRIGVPQIFLSVDSNTLVPSLSSLTFTASAIGAVDSYQNDNNPTLSSSDTYQVMVGLVGRDLVSGGYTIGQCSPSSGNLVTTTNNPYIQVKVPNANWPANFQYATAVAVFLKINNANFQLAQFAYLDPSNDFSTAIQTKPLRVAPSFTNAVLQGTTSDSILGSRAPYGITYEEITPTTGTFNFRRPVATVTVSPNTGADFQIATTRSVGVRFESLVNDVKAWVQAAAGNFISYNDGVDLIIEGQMSLNTAQALIKGNRALQVFMPADFKGFQEVRLLLGNLTVSQQEITEAWSKTAPTPVAFQFDPASLDKLITNQHSEISFVRRIGG